MHASGRPATTARATARGRTRGRRSLGLGLLHSNRGNRGNRGVPPKNAANVAPILPPVPMRLAYNLGSGRGNKARKRQTLAMFPLIPPSLKWVVGQRDDREGDQPRKWRNRRKGKGDAERHGPRTDSGSFAERRLGTTYIGFLIRPACFIFMLVAAIVNVLPAPTAWAQQRVAGTHATPDGAGSSTAFPGDRHVREFGR
jgi:hypothetical protein